jgi:hypothetical protein
VSHWFGDNNIFFGVNMHELLQPIPIEQVVFTIVSDEHYGVVEFDSNF